MLLGTVFHIFNCGLMEFRYRVHSFSFLVAAPDIQGMPRFQAVEYVPSPADRHRGFSRCGRILRRIAIHRVWPFAGFQFFPDLSETVLYLWILYVAYAPL